MSNPNDLQRHGPAPLPCAPRMRGGRRAPRAESGWKGSPAPRAGELLGPHLSRSATTLPASVSVGGTTSVGRTIMAVRISAVGAIIALPIVRLRVAVPISIGRALVAAHPHAPLWSPPPARATVRRVGPVIAVPIGVLVMTVPIRVRATMLIPPAVERIGTGSHAVGAASRGPFVAASAAVRPATHDGASAAMRSPAASAFGRRRPQRRAAQGNRRSGQTNRYLAHHDAHSVCAEHPSLSESNSAVSDELQRCGTVTRVRLQNPTPNDMLMNAR